MSSLGAWVLDVVACPAPGGAAPCGGRLAALPGGEWLRCRRCGAPYPVLAGVPVLVPAPGLWVATYREAVLATLAEHGAATRSTVSLVGEIAAAAQAARGAASTAAEPMTFGDDWAAGEGDVTPRPAGGSAAAGAFAGFLDGVAALGPEAAVLERLPAKVRTLVEVGAGAGRLGPALARRAARVITGDVSLRAVLRARAALPAARAAGVVLDAEALPLRAGAVDALVAAALVDLLADPEAFLDGVAAALTARGVAVVTTPEPDLGRGDDGVLAELARAAGLVAEVSDGVPWIRPHGARYYQVYFAQVVRLTRRARARAARPAGRKRAS